MAKILSKSTAKVTGSKKVVVETSETPALTLESQINTRATAYCSKPDPRYRGSRAEHER